MAESNSGNITTGRLVPPKPSALSAETVDAVRRDRDRLRGQVQRDFDEFPTDPQAVRSNLGESPSPDTVQTANKIALTLKSDLEKKGFSVELRTVQPIDAIREGTLYEIPQHHSLIIKAGTAKGPFARELRRLEKYLSKRMNDPQLSREIRDLEFPVRIDPLVSVVTNAQGFFSTSAAYGQGMHLAPASLFAGQDVTLEVMRHELRHMKNHFDLMSGKPNTNRAIFFDPSAPLGKNLDNYSNLFVVDEIEGFKANLRNSQSKLGRETEAYRKQIAKYSSAASDTADASKKLTKQYKKAVESIQREARTYADRIESFINISYENATFTRTMIADPGHTTAQFASRISIVEQPFAPGIAEVSIDLSKEGKGKGRTLILQMPTAVTAKGTEAIRENAMAYLVELDSYLLERKRELTIRRTDINRDPLTRLPPHVRQSPSEPDSN